MCELWASLKEVKLYSEIAIFFFYFLNLLSKIVIHLGFYIRGGIVSLTFHFILFKTMMP